MPIAAMLSYMEKVGRLMPLNFAKQDWDSGNVCLSVLTKQLSMSCSRNISGKHLNLFTSEIKKEEEEKKRNGETFPFCVCIPFPKRLNCQTLQMLHFSGSLLLSNKCGALC